MQINEGQLEKVTCPAFNEAIGKMCDSFVTENARKEIGVSDELNAKFDKFSFNKAVERMEDAVWCPNPGCNGIAKVDVKRRHGKCIDCQFQFCTGCMKAYHPMRRCEATMLTSDHQSQADENIERKLEELAQADKDQEYKLKQAALELMH